MLNVNETKECENVSKWAEYKKDWNEMKNMSDFCPLIKRCNRTNLRIDQTFTDKPSNTSSDIVIRIRDPTIQFVKDSYSYDLQSFIGEVGGTLGLMLGYSFMTLIDLIEFFSQSFKMNQ